MRLIHCIW